MKKSAFTLIELLVVISIIAILAGIALPVFNTVIAKARMTTAGSNLKQWGIGVAAYLNDHDDDMISGDATWSATTDGTDGLFGKYITNQKVFQLPWDKREVTKDPLKNFPVSISFNHDILKPTKAVAPGEWSGNMSRLAKPSKTIMAAPNYNEGTGDPGIKTSWGSDSVNIGTSVKSIPAGGGIIGTSGPKFKGLPGNGDRIAILYCDVHVETIRIFAGEATNPAFQDSFKNPANWSPK